MTTTATPALDHDQIRRTLSLLTEPGQVVEVRLIGASRYEKDFPHIASGYFNDADKLVAELERAGRAKGTYVILNPFNPNLLARANNRISHEKGLKTTSDIDVTSRRLLLIDADAIRPSDTSSSDEEHEAALELARDIRGFLSDTGWPDPVVADSGNGGHLIYLVDLPVQDGGLVERALKTIAILFDNDTVKIDQSVFSPGQLCKLYGTMARKGDDSPDIGRPHRMAKLLEVPEKWEPVQRTLIAELIELDPATEPTQQKSEDTSGLRGMEKWVQDWLSKNKIETGGLKHNADKRAVWVLTKCPFCGHVGTGKATVSIDASGKIGFRCWHDQCQGKRWQELKAHFEPNQQNGHKPNAQGQVGILLSEVVPEQVRWLWPGRLALGKVHTFDGDPGIGKTLLMLCAGARVTRNRPMPGEEQSYASGGVVLVCLEDGLSDTIQPRLARADADLERVVSIGYLKETTADGKEYERPFTIGDLDVLERAIKRVNAKLVIIDPVMAILGGKDTYKDNEVRAALAPLKEIAERLNCAIVMIRHVVKGGGEKAIYLGGGSIAFIGLARIGLLAVKNPDNQEQFIFANIKNNLVKASPKLLYSIASEDGVDERPYIKWEGISTYTDQELIRPPSKNTGDNRQEIKRILEECKPIAKTVAELAEDMPEMSMSNLKKTLGRMYDRREIGKSARGAYHAL